MRTETQHRHTRRFFAFAAALAVFAMAGCLEENRDEGAQFSYKVLYQEGGVPLESGIYESIGSTDPEESIREVTATVVCFEKGTAVACPAGYQPVWSIPGASLGVETEADYFSILGQVINPTTLKITLKFRKSKLLAIQADRQRDRGHQVLEFYPAPVRVEVNDPGDIFSTYIRLKDNDLDVSVTLHGTYPGRSIAPP